ncbi:cyclophilin type peptidyl-prolyl cis-trans isomerase [Nitritalea halalkaliphila LW7]|uniref:Peptidyl-prolyl cis-trans isomerase n=1 Tax=Nitritalea halalkaliphila LW7 TaxID=1189621 RepID=I5CA24_9BACT|nr:peptidylprolyl isomerase [Nitritalea halalkaliphila]EIM78676.1 cyclophilin type peptidyl-prolyl cis-trans isomerase [Nitritalea halalkaliphila LW7]
MDKQYLHPIFILFVGLMAWGCASERDTLVRIDTRHGELVAILFDETPKHKENFLKLAKAGRFDSTEFHRVIENFMIQGGDVFGKEELPREDWYTVPAEIKPELFHQKGALAAARMGNNVNPERASSGSQFYIVQGKKYTASELTTDKRKLNEQFMKYLGLESQKPLRATYTAFYEAGDMQALDSLVLAYKGELESFYSLDLGKKIAPERVRAYVEVGGTPHLDDEYTVFGQLLSGFEVLDKIAAEPTNRSDKPEEPVYMRVTLQEMSKEKISKAYGYTYRK